jgi:hypothetical protein
MGLGRGGAGRVGGGLGDVQAGGAGRVVVDLAGAVAEQVVGPGFPVFGWAAEAGGGRGGVGAAADPGDRGRGGRGLPALVGPRGGELVQVVVLDCVSVPVVLPELLPCRSEPLGSNDAAVISRYDLTCDTLVRT